MPLTAPFQTHAYGDDPAQRLLWSVPPRTGGAPPPLLALVHGGGWVAGSPDGDSYRWLMEFGRRCGWAVASIGYRLAPAARFPAPVADVRQALAWLQQRASDLGCDARRPWLLGSSAGANLVALAALAAPAGTFGGVVTVALPADFRPPSPAPAEPRPSQGAAPSPPSRRPLFRQSGDDPALLAYLGARPEAAPELAAAASPVAQVRAGAPPFLVIHSRRDPRVDCRCSLRFVRALRAAGVPVRFQTLGSPGHSLAIALPALEAHLPPFMDVFDERFRPFDGQQNRLH